MSDVTLLADAVGLAVTAPPLAGVEIANNASRRFVELRGGQFVRASFAESLGNALIGCRIEIARLGGGVFAELVPTFFSRGVINGLVLSEEVFFSPGDEASVGNVLTEVRAVIVGNGVLSPVIRYVVLHIR